MTAIYIYIYMALCTMFASHLDGSDWGEASIDGLLWPLIITANLIRKILH
jgi:hypothetical protein